LTGVALAWVFAWVLAPLPPQAGTVSDTTMTIETHIDPNGDAELEGIRDFLVPRLAVLAEGGEASLVLELRRREAGDLSARLFAGDTLLTERLGPVDGNEGRVALWLALKGAWVRAQEPDPDPLVGGPPANVLISKKVVNAKRVATERRRVALALTFLPERDGLSAGGLTLGFEPDPTFIHWSGEFGYALAPVDGALDKHRLFAQTHVGLRATEFLAAEATLRASAIVARGEQESDAAFDLAAGVSLRIELTDTLWFRPTLFGHPTQQRFLTNSNNRASRRVSMAVAAGAHL